MKVAISAMGPDLNAAMDPRFGRARYFLIIEPQTMEFEVLSNPNIDTMGGAGIQSAQLIGKRGIEAVITGQVGPNAFQTLSAIGVRIHEIMSGTVRQAIDAYKAGRLPAISQPGPGQAGMGMWSGIRPGRGGASRGRRGGMGAGFGPFQTGPGFGPGQTFFASPQRSKEQEIQALKKQSEILRKQYEEINRRLQELEAKDAEKKRNRSE